MVGPAGIREGPRSSQVLIQKGPLPGLFSFAWGSGAAWARLPGKTREEPFLRLRRFYGVVGRSQELVEFTASLNALQSEPLSGGRLRARLPSELRKQEPGPHSLRP